MAAATHSLSITMSMILGIRLFRPHPRQRIDILFDYYYSTSWKNNCFIAVGFLGFLRHIMNKIRLFCLTQVIDECNTQLVSSRGH